MKLKPKLVARGSWATTRGAALVAALTFGGCKSGEPIKPSPAEWMVPQRGARATKPPARLTSPIAPPPEPDRDRPTNAPAAPAKSLNQSLAQLAAAPPAEPQKLFSFSAKDLEVKDALAL